MKLKSIEKPKKNAIKGFRVVENECIWMKAGVVNFKLCDNNYDCFHCAFDKGMQKTLNSRKPADPDKPFVHWSEALQNKYKGVDRPCRHALTGRVKAPKICTSNYECYHCAYDQLLDEMDAAGIGKRPHYTLASGYRVADDYYYHPGHAWIRFEHSGRVRMGLDEFSTRLFGVADTIDLPSVGVDLKQTQVGLSIIRDGQRADFLSPVSGTVLALNHQALKTPKICHADPYDQGWLMIIEPQTPRRHLKNLYFGNDSVQWIEKETARLFALLGPEYEKLAATGGRPVDDIFGALPQIGWKKLTRTFLHT